MGYLITQYGGSTDFTPRRILKLVHRGQYRTVGGVCYLRLHCSLLCSVAVGRRHLRVESARVLRRQASLDAGTSFIGQPERLILNELATKLAHPSTKRTTLHNIFLVAYCLLPTLSYVGPLCCKTVHRITCFILLPFLFLCFVRVEYVTPSSVLLALYVVVLCYAIFK